ELLLHPRYNATLPQLLDFLERRPNHPQKKRIEKMVETRLSETMQEKEAWTWFDRHPPVSAAARTYYTQLLLSKKRVAEAFPLWKRLYLDGMVLPEDLKEKTVEFERQLGVADREKRARNLIKNGSHINLANFVQSFPKNRRDYFLALEAATTGNEKLFSEYRRRLPKKEANQSELWYARIEWLRSHGSLDKTYEMLMGPEGRHLNVNDSYKLRYKLAKYFSGHDRLKEAFNLLNLKAREKGAEQEDFLWLSGWTAHLLKRDGQAIEMFKLLGKKAKTGSLRSQGAWWAAELSHSKKAKKAWIDQAAQFPDTFYGLLALETRDGRLPNLKRSASQCDIIRDPRIKEDFQRMLWLRDVGRNYYNGREAENLAQRYNLGTEERLCLASNSGAYDYAINLARDMKKGGQFYWQGLYPVPDWEPGWGWQLDPALIWGMTRQESMFDVRSKSSAQAQGLLQIIPATAEEEARLSSFPPPNPRLIYDPAYNLALGQAYIKRMLSTFKGDLVLALCAYNAGPGRAEKWSERRQIEPTLTFIENIPFTETRNYVKLVINGMVHYQLILFGKGSILKVIKGDEPGSGSS
ncbi:MAG TPA: lytic transglycosylase domain-containing protein, partial [Magnetococcales bacterium]|nr:lytic transglycosylase domain-containing protein [Magnetococcales bacterium]